MFASLPLALGALLAQCTDPNSTFGFDEHLDLPLSYTDGYQTLLDIRVPRAAPGPCGWPLLVFVHGSGTGRFRVETEARQLAADGFVTVAYDVRGQGDAMALNDPNLYGREFLGLRERIDLFEVMEAAEALFPDAIDFDRIGVTGKSQGGVHAWFAAAHSGRSLPPNPWRTAPAPVIRAAMAINFVPQFIDQMFPGRETVSQLAMQQWYDPAGSGIHSPPSVYALIEPYLATEDFAGLTAAIDDPALDLRQLLAQSTVPMLCELVYDDVFGPANLVIDEWANLAAPGTRRVLTVSTFGHGTPLNERESAWREFARVLWFERHLKGIPNLSDDWEEFRFPITPADPAQYNAWSSVWDVRRSDQWPLPGASTLNWYLDGQGGLQEQPVAGSASFTIDQVWGQAYDVLDYAAALPSPEQLQQSVLPRDVANFVSAPLSETLLFLGTPRVTLPTRCDEADFQLHVSLYDHTTGRYLSGGTHTVRGNTQNSEQMVEVALNFTGTEIPAGHQLRLEVDHLGWHRPASGPSVLHALPVFSDFDAQIRVGGPSGAQLEMPIVPRDEALLIAELPYLDRQGNPDAKIFLRLPEERPGWQFQILAGTSGSAPGTSFRGVPVPLNPDYLMLRILAHAGNLPIAGFHGNLAPGQTEVRASVAWSQLTPIPAVVQQLHFVGVLLDPAGVTAEVTRAETVPIDN